MPEAILSAREAVGGGLHRFELKVDAELAASHTLHAQYIELRHDFGGAAASLDADSTVPGGYFVLACAPHVARWVVGVKEAGAMAERLLQLPIGSVLVCSTAQGRGFPIDAAAGRPLVLAVTGSGIAAVLSVIGARVATRQAASTYLLYGVRERKDVALAPELEAMRAAGVQVAI